jgi:hypothetical protein
MNIAWAGLTHKESCEEHGLQQVGEAMHGSPNNHDPLQECVVGIQPDSKGM